MALRRRLSIIAAASVGVAILIAVLVCYAVVRSQLRSQVDASLRTQATAIQQGQVQSLHPQSVPSIPASAGGPAPYAQIYAASVGTDPLNGLALPVTAHTRAIAADRAGAYLCDFQIGGTHLREITFPVSLTNGTSLAVQLARPLNGVASVLSSLRLVLLLVLLGGVVVAGRLDRIEVQQA